MEKRREALIALGADYGLEPDGAASYSGQEDFDATLDDEDPDYPLERFASVTHSGEYAYIRCWATLDAARAYSVENTGDGTYAEGPGEIVDLDTGTHYTPDWSTLQWAADGPQLVPAYHAPDVVITTLELEIIIDALDKAAEEWDYMIGLPESDGYDRDDLAQRRDRAERLLAELNKRK